MSYANIPRADGDAAFGAYGEFLVNPLAAFGVLGDAPPTMAHGEPDEPVFSALGVSRAALDDGRTKDGRTEIGLASEAR